MFSLFIVHTTHFFATMLCNVLDAFCNTSQVDGKAAHDALVEALMQVI